MVSVNRAFGNNGVGGIGGEKRPETKKDDTPKTLINELKVYREDENGVKKLIYSDGKDDVIVCLDKDGNIKGTCV